MPRQNYRSRRNLRAALALVALLMPFASPVWGAAPGIVERANDILSSTRVDGDAQVDVSSKMCPFTTATELSTLYVGPGRPEYMQRIVFESTSVFGFAPEGDPGKELELIIRFKSGEPCLAILKRMSF
jgi:hypothetical protein